MSVPVLRRRRALLLLLLSGGRAAALLLHERGAVSVDLVADAVRAADREVGVRRLKQKSGAWLTHLKVAGEANADVTNN